MSDGFGQYHRFWRYVIFFKSTSVTISDLSFVLFWPVGTCTSCSGAGVTTCSSSGTPTSCGAVGSTQYYLSASACVTSCPSGTSGSLSGTSASNSSPLKNRLLHINRPPKQLVLAQRVAPELCSAADRQPTNGAFDFDSLCRISYQSSRSSANSYFSSPVALYQASNITWNPRRLHAFRFQVA